MNIGAGTGYFSVRVAKAIPGGTLYAVDVEPSMLDHIRKRALGEGLENVITVQASGASPNLPKPVDVAIVVDTYHHLPKRPTYFRELQKSLGERRTGRDHRLPEGLARGASTGVPLRRRPDHWRSHHLTAVMTCR